MKLRCSKQVSSYFRCIFAANWLAARFWLACVQSMTWLNQLLWDRLPMPALASDAPVSLDQVDGAGMFLVRSSSLQYISPASNCSVT